MAASELSVYMQENNLLSIGSDMTASVVIYKKWLQYMMTCSTHQANMQLFILVLYGGAFTITN